MISGSGSSRSRAELKRAPILRRFWALPTYVLAGLVLPVSYVLVLRNVILTALDTGQIGWIAALVVTAPWVLMVWLPIQAWIVGAMALRRLRRAYQLDSGAALRHVRFGLRGAHDLGEILDSPAFVNGNGQGLIMCMDQGIVFWNPETLEREGIVRWGTISQIDVEMFATSIWRRQGIRLTCPQGSSVRQVTFGVQSVAFGGLFPIKEAQLQDFQAALVALRETHVATSE